MVTVHRIEIRKSLNEPPTYTAHCSCGYESPSAPIRRWAEDDGDVHVLEIIKGES